MFHEEYSGLPLVGVRPWLMGLILFFLMMLIPLGTTPIEVPYPGVLGITLFAPQIYGIFWTFYDWNFSINTFWLDYEFLLYVVPTVIFDIIFVLVVTGYYKGLFSSRVTILVCALSFLIPITATGITTGFLLENGGYLGSIPIIQIIGLIMLFMIRGPEIETIDDLSDFNPSQVHEVVVND